MQLELRSAHMTKTNKPNDFLHVRKVAVEAPTRPCVLGYNDFPLISPSSTSSRCLRLVATSRRHDGRRIKSDGNATEGQAPP